MSRSSAQRDDAPGASPGVLLDPLAVAVQGPDAHALRIALALPTSGALGMTAPAALACAVLAAEEVNAAGGVLGRPLRLVPVDAGRPAAEVAAEVGRLALAGVVDAVCGHHTSDVHRRLGRVTAGRLPYVFTPPHEGGPREAGVVLLGEGPAEQLLPVAAHLASRRTLRRWALLGNDYVWPRTVHAAAVPLLRAAGAEVVRRELVPVGGVDAERLVEGLRRSRVQAVLLSLIGRDLASFNRAFTAAGLGPRIVRVSPALEENGLLEAGGDDSGELFAVMRWFASGSGELPARYADRWGAAAPPLGSYAQGCYEGVHLLAGMARQEPLPVLARRSHHPVPHGPVRLARADGVDLTVVT
ncbi:ABC transporter substrate-binding protein [Kineococcus xinjiangensis]|nr:ABC transporter substrate-binding protein [Kineococcus xinjiangensis]